MIDEDGTVIHEVRFAHPVDRVWEAVVDPTALAKWLMPNDSEPRLGHRFHFDGGPPRGLFEAEVLDLDPPRRIQWRWMIDGIPTTVTITLQADDEGTLLRLEHADLPVDPRPRFDGGWVEKFDSLDSLLKETV